MTDKIKYFLKNTLIKSKESSFGFWDINEQHRHTYYFIIKTPSGFTYLENGHFIKEYRQLELQF